MIDLNATAAAEIRAELARQNMSIRELSRRTGIGYWPLARRIRGDLPLTVNELATCADALGVSLLALLQPGQRTNGSEEP